MSETTTTGTLRCDKCGREPLPAGEQYPCGLDGEPVGRLHGDVRLSIKLG